MFDLQVEDLFAIFNLGPLPALLCREAITVGVYGFAGPRP